MEIRKGDTALVTGASKGMGRHIVRTLAGRGLRFVIAARSMTELDETANELRDLGCDVAIVQADMGSRDSVTELAERALAAYGGIDILVNNAGVESALRFDQRSLDDIDSMIAINLTGPLLLSRLLLPRMLERGRGHFVNISSAAGVVPTAYEEVYSGSKAGLMSFTRALRLSAQDMKWPVSASVILPGFMTGTGMYENARNAFGGSAPAFAGTMDAKALGDAVLRVIEADLPDLYLMPGPARLNAATSIVAPRFFEWLMAKLDIAAFFRGVAKKRAADPQ
ncbi:SDR family NAD(P)-dependent oxidoreductase [Solimonas terrae]|uniref:SDR family NAD(P)-dependent oxidoreductase n=1 Tax=Solimonas terrae TaxID=1396819 RepID=A0A6M2BS75_9GAMM|nr:SDR family NAD(P)-dependent oxidoreductase [Solimonas terrae]NGY05338.1 SDR family NAD(P)-dependent oxidoreductase [Solimonas terrae]